MNHESSDSLRDELTKEIGNCGWGDLKDHAARGALLFLATSLELVEVALAVVLDDSPLVEQWVQENLLVKPGREQIEKIESDPSAVFRFVVVQPFVLAKRRSH